MADFRRVPESTCARVGKLYAYFLEVSQYFMDSLVHEEMEVARTGDGMFQDLSGRLANGEDGRNIPETYRRLIRADDSLSNLQKQLLAPDSGIINVNRLDFSIYLKIFIYLGGNIERNDVRYMCNLRNTLCHCPLQDSMSQVEFMELCDNMTNEFREFNFSDGFLEWCMASISIDN